MFGFLLYETNNIVLTLVNPSSYYATKGTTLVSILQKAAMGQMFFGPSFTCIFFASALVQSGQFTLGNWIRKIKSDLAGAWLAGVGFWPLVDLISYSLVPPRFIPLFVNVCSLVWNIYLSIVANRKTKTSAA
jgi:protein Mpv17